jgi:hypothetical protein
MKQQTDNARQVALKMCKELLKGFIENCCWTLASDMIEIARALDVYPSFKISKLNIVYTNKDKEWRPKEIGYIKKTIDKLNLWEG